MAVQFKAGSAVRQKVTPVEGTVVRFVLDETTGDIIYIVAGTDGQEYSFTEDSIEAA